MIASRDRCCGRPESKNPTGGLGLIPCPRLSEEAMRAMPTTASRDALPSSGITGGAAEQYSPRAMHIVMAADEDDRHHSIIRSFGLRYLSAHNMSEPK